MGSQRVRYDWASNRDTFRTRGRSQGLSEATFLQTRNGGRGKAFLPRRAPQGPAQVRGSPTGLSFLGDQGSDWLLPYMPRCHLSGRLPPHRGSAELVTVVPTLCISFPWLIYFETGSMSLLIFLTHSLIPSPHGQQHVCSLFRCLGSFVFCFAIHI